MPARRHQPADAVPLEGKVRRHGPLGRLLEDESRAEETRDEPGAGRRRPKGRAVKLVRPPQRGEPSCTYFRAQWCMSERCASGLRRDRPDVGALRIATGLPTRSCANCARYRRSREGGLGPDGVQQATLSSPGLRASIPCERSGYAGAASHKPTPSPLIANCCD